MIEATIPVGGPEQIILMFGAADQHLRRIRESLPAKIATRDGRIFLSGDEQAVLQATAVFERLKQAIASEGALKPEQVTAILEEVVGGKAPPAPKMAVKRPGVTIRPRTDGQAAYVEAIRSHELIFSSGPAGTGKTFLAVAAAVEAMADNQIRKIVLVRPAVEAGESLGFLPGDLQAKINPYLRPLLDALGDMMDYEQLKRYTADDVIEVAPLAYMRGRTLNNAFVIMDEAQNSTVAQMKMFLTRLGAGSKMLVTGDTTQVDLPKHTRSGLTDAISRLRGIDGVACVTLGKEDIVRHRLVNDIVKAYDQGQQG
ncbi:PhoH-like protein [Pseudobythopirellula maris]|uniref:PhoH-like protein n=1 Tax=Pseudobythopirellula maris TaxID=2527991 RepID=A0A5C5ZPU9_9BACT|nr:PhoH family protein [Pseudobythopirellula maris]TWT88363.1 PhoH-like protein [Pseudobythopirellula maris]